MALSVLFSRGPDPEVLSFAICGAKLDLAGEAWTVPAGKVLSRSHSDKVFFTSGLETVPENPDMTSIKTAFLDVLPPIDAIGFESPEKLLVPPRARGRGRRMQKLGSKGKPRFSTN